MKQQSRHERSRSSPPPNEVVFAAAVVDLAYSAAKAGQEFWQIVSPGVIERLAADLLTPNIQCEPTPAAIVAAIERSQDALDADIMASLDGADDLASFLLARMSIEYLGIRGWHHVEYAMDAIRAIAPRAGRVNGYTILELAELANEICELTMDQLNAWITAVENPTAAESSWRPANAPHEAYDLAAVSREDLARRSRIEVRVDLWNTLKAMIGYMPDRRVDDKLLYARNRPLYVLHEDRCFITNLTHALDCLWNSWEEHWFKHSPKRLYQRLQRAKSTWLEDRIAQCLTRVFPTGCVFSNVSYPDPAKPGRKGARAELDTAVHWGSSLILVEAKAKQYALERGRTSIGALKGSVKNNVASAFEQSRRAESYIRAVPQARFVEDATGRTLHLAHRDLDDIYHVAVTFRRLGLTLDGLASLSSIGLFRESQYPWALTWSDLDVITTFAETPEVLLHYLRQRRRQERLFAGSLSNELELFGTYLNNRLPLPTAVDGPTVIDVRGRDAKFHQWIRFKRGWSSEDPQIRFNVPGQIRRLLHDITLLRGERPTQLVAFRVLDLQPDQLLSLAWYLEGLSRLAPMVEDTTLEATRVGDLLVCSLLSSESSPSIYHDLSAYVVTSNYEVGAPVGIGLWFRANSGRLTLRGCCHVTVQSSSQIPGRNDRCFCGRHTKFKNCCWQSLQHR